MYEKLMLAHAAQKVRIEMRMNIRVVDVCAQQSTAHTEINANTALLLLCMQHRACLCVCVCLRALSHSLSRFLPFLSFASFVK